MKTKIIFCIVATLLLSATTFAQIGKIKDAGKKIAGESTKQAKTTAEETVKEKAVDLETQDPRKVISLDGKDANIVFSSEPIAAENLPASKKHFKTGENVYAFVTLSKSVRQHFQNVSPNAKLDVEIFLYSMKISPYEWIKDPVEEQLVFANMKVSGSLLDNKYLIIDLLPDPVNTTAYGTEEISYRKFGTNYDGPVAFAQTLSEKLEPGKNVVKVLVKLNYEDVASGLIQITGDDFEAYAGLSKKLNEAAAVAGTKSASLPKAEKTDSVMEKQMISTIKSSNAWTSKRLDATEILKLNIYDADWHIRRHQISGAILHRYIRAAVAVKTQSGTCAYYIITFQEDYIGGKFQPMKYDGATDKVTIECSNLK